MIRKLYFLASSAFSGRICVSFMCVPKALRRTKHNFARLFNHLQCLPRSYSMRPCGWDLIIKGTTNGAEQKEEVEVDEATSRLRRIKGPDQDNEGGHYIICKLVIHLRNNEFKKWHLGYSLCIIYVKVRQSGRSLAWGVVKVDEGPSNWFRANWSYLPD